MMKTKTKNPIQIIKSGEMAVWVDFDGRYQTNQTIVRVVDFNTDSNEYLVKLEDKSWEVLSLRDVRPVTI